MIVKARVNMVLEISADEFPMPVDGDPTEELEDMLEELVGQHHPTKQQPLNIKCTGAQLND